MVVQEAHQADDTAIARRTEVAAIIPIVLHARPPSTTFSTQHVASVLPGVLAAAGTRFLVAGQSVKPEHMALAAVQHVAWSLPGVVAALETRLCVAGQPVKPEQASVQQVLVSPPLMLAEFVSRVLFVPHPVKSLHMGSKQHKAVWLPNVVAALETRLCVAGHS